MAPGARRAAFTIILLIVALALVLAAVLYTVNKRRENAALGMMDEARHLKVGTSDMADVLAFANRHNASVSASHQKSCTYSDCLVVAGVPPEESVPKHPKLDIAYNHLVRRAWLYAVFMWVRDGKLAAQQQWFMYTTPRRDLAVITETSRGAAGLCRHPSYRLHNAYIAEVAPHHFNVWVDSKAQEADAISQLDLRCVGTLRGCRAASEMAPEAWHRYERDESVLQAESETGLQEAITACAAAFPASR
jgi:hypothetical protein